MDLVPTVVLLGAALSAYLALSARSLRRRRAFFRNRAPLSAEEIYSRFFAAEGLNIDSVTRYWVECARRLEIPPPLLRPEDSFHSELKTSRWLDPFDDRKEDLARYALEEAKKRNAALERVTTFGGLVIALVRLDEVGKTIERD